MDSNGYPGADDLETLKQELNTFHFVQGAEALGGLIEATGYGRVTIGEGPSVMVVTTGGWSGCEDILSAAAGSWWWSRHWESTHRGGLYVFRSRG